LLILVDAISTTIVRNNRFRCDRGWDIDLDDGSTNYHIYNNLCLNGGIKLREGFYRVVENNILVNNTFHPHVWFNNSGDVFARNIVMTPYQPINIPNWGSGVNYNIFTDNKALEEARKRNTDNRSIVYPVRFENPETGDYRITLDATPVFRMGFQNIAMNKFGVVSPRLKQIAKTPKMSTPVIGLDRESANLVEWQGLYIKNLETPGERSATGMDSERGVYVVTIIKYDAPLRDFLQPNDVILKFAGHSVNNLDDLYKAIEQANLKAEQEMVVFRNQRENVIRIPANVMR